MAQDELDPKRERVRDARRSRAVRHATMVFREAGKRGARALRRRGHVSSAMPKRGMAAGVRAAAGLISPGSRRVIVKARYTRIVRGDLGAARAHLKYIVRDGVSRDGEPGRLYGRDSDAADPAAFLARSERDPHQFRFVVSADEGARLSDLKPFIRDLVAQMERDLDTKLDWVAVDHFNTGHPHTHIVVRGRDDQGRDLVMARDYISHGVRARAQSLITLELGPETDLERLQKRFNEVGQERLTALDRSLTARASQGLLAITSTDAGDPEQQAMRTQRLRTLERLGLARERTRGVWQLDPRLEAKLRQLGERADKFKMMQRALKLAGIERSAMAMALFERGPRKAPLIGRVVEVGMVDEISDRTWVVIDGAEGCVHYAELGRLRPGEAPVRDTIVVLASNALAQGRPSGVPRLQELSPVPLQDQIGYQGPTWLDQAIVSRWRPEAGTPGFAAEIDAALSARGRWLVDHKLAEVANGAVRPQPHMMEALRAAEADRLVQDLSRRLKATFVPTEPGQRVSGRYDQSLVTPSGRLAVIRREDTFTLAPWRPTLEPLRGRAVIGTIGPTKVAWSLERGRTLPGRS
jgi:type IV secretory pathway VirD2 relaxase